MKGYKILYNEETGSFYSKEFAMINESDFSHEPETNVYDYRNTHIIFEELNIELVEGLNQEIKDGELEVIKCKDCGNFFLIDKDEKEWYTNKGLNIPKRCGICRDNRKEETSNDYRISISLQRKDK